MVERDYYRLSYSPGAESCLGWKVRREYSVPQRELYSTYRLSVGTAAVWERAPDPGSEQKGGETRGSVTREVCPVSHWVLCSLCD